ncbi:MAG: helix-turn-helix transcriptional regulator [Pseudolabrys sp.]|nr:helix-turn-helix transcriptional regulator [Pseudolabrys sp.]
MTSKAFNSTDKYVGARLRMRRLMLDLSQTEVADHVGLTFQQIQKYEKGFNRISASRLQQFGTLLHVPVSFFFEGAPSQNEGHRSTGRSLENEFIDFLSTSEGLAIAKAFVAIKNPSLRRSIVSMVEKIANESDRRKAS